MTLCKRDQKRGGTGNVQRVEGTTPYAKFLKGEIPVWISYENDGLKAKFVDGGGGVADALFHPPRGPA